MSKRVFISSPVYDLIDVRAELAEFFQRAGLRAVLSEFPSSDFTIAPDANSIETCLINVSACDYFLCILSQRYGSRVGNLGYDNVSTTHLEYRRALSEGKPILFYVRDRLASDFEIWKRQEHNRNINYAWVRSVNDFGLFDLLEEHQTHVKRNNWCCSFRNSLDLKEAVRNHLRIPRTEAALETAIEQNLIPILEIEVDAGGQFLGDNWDVSLGVSIKNVGTVPGFNVKLYSINQDDSVIKELHTLPVFGSGQQMQQTLRYMKQPADVESGRRMSWLRAEMRLPCGAEIHDKFEVFIEIKPREAAISHRAALVSRRYFVSSDPEAIFKIEVK